MNLTELYAESFNFCSYKLRKGLTEFDEIISHFKDLSTQIMFPEFVKVFKIYLGLAVNSVRNEQSFSKLKLINTYLRQSQNQERLSALAIISFEKETLDKLDISKIIDQFISNKSRKLKFEIKNQEYAKQLLKEIEKNK